MQEGQGVISQEGNVGVVDQGREVERIAKKGRQEIARTASQKREEKELHHVEVEVEREESSIGDL